MFRPWLICLVENSPPGLFAPLSSSSSLYETPDNSTITQCKHKYVKIRRLKAKNMLKTLQNQRRKRMPSGVFRILQRGGHGKRVEREPITGVWGRSPLRNPGAQPLFEGKGGKVPLKLKHFLLLNVQWKLQICPFLKFGNAKNHRYLRCFSQK